MSTKFNNNDLNNKMNANASMNTHTNTNTNEKEKEQYAQRSASADLRVDRGMGVDRGAGEGMGTAGTHVSVVPYPATVPVVVPVVDRRRIECMLAQVKQGSGPLPTHLLDQLQALQ